MAKLSNTAFAKKARACYKKHKKSRSAYWRCVNKGKKWRGRGSCEHGRVTRGPRKGQCRKVAPVWAKKARRRAARED